MYVRGLKPLLVAEFVYLPIVCYLRNVKTFNILKQIAFILVALMCLAGPASAQFFHRKGGPAPAKTKEAPAAKVKVDKKEIKIKQKQEAKAAAVVAAPKEELVPVIAVKKEKKTNPALTDTDWYLLDVNGNPLNTNGGDAPVMKLSSKHRDLSGNTGCNTMGGKYETTKHLEIKFMPATTKRACNSMSNETYMLNALVEANLYEINGSNLLLYHDNLLLAIFEGR